ncbi:MAG TPA: GNAT family N-acetyltransferase [Rhodopila sp.]|uniref:GNAT family N-acetyltransferase n=1 Tax=Rhodopila sp. TaxID=2480087 RepID=UPI002D1A72E2|nr:GNAT family N-acetyltransferase [Rhodopila sp.]HVY14088.1 GNAT family N-acetyltransferase [Rhodopila sp.]
MSANAARKHSDYCLRRPETAEDWQAYHAIRRRVFNLPRPEVDQSPDSFPLVLFVGSLPVGAIQVDRLGEHAAALRLVAIDSSCQGCGHGRVMLRQAEDFVRDLGCCQAVVYATPEAAGFYMDSGYDEEDWDPVCLGGIVQMQKKLR